MKRIMYTASLFVFLLAMKGNSIVAAEVVDADVKAAAKEAVKGRQCIILNRAKREMEREILSAPSDDCYIQIDNWTVKTNFLLKSTEILSPQNEQWWVSWSRGLPIVAGKDWSFKVKIRSMKKIMAVVTYNF